MSGSETIECIYEGGVLKPFEKIKLKENARVRVIIKESVAEKTFGILKVSEAEIEEAFGELEDEWAFY
jgi:predicted DNA-binding antitoxin AbrB/MazE fold protein